MEIKNRPDRGSNKRQPDKPLFNFISHHEVSNSNIYKINYKIIYLQDPDIEDDEFLLLPQHSDHSSLTDKLIP